LIDRPVVEIFVNDGRASHVAVNDYFPSNTTAIVAFNDGTAPVTVSSAEAYGMGCGWTATRPTPTATPTTE
jgi:hypothetical protein